VADAAPVDALVAEIGSTTTVLSAFDGLDPGAAGPPRLVGQGSARTSVATGDITLGVDEARAALEEAVGPLEGQFHSFLEASGVFGVKPVYDDLYVVLDIALKVHLLVCAHDLLIDPCPSEPFLVEVGQELLVGALLLPHDRCEDGDGLSPECILDLAGNGIGRLLLDTYVVHRAVGRADTGIEETQVIIYLCYRPHRRAGILRRRLLFDGYRRREAIDGVDVGFVHQPQELACIGRERLDVSPLTLCVYGIERKS